MTDKDTILVSDDQTDALFSIIKVLSTTKVNGKPNQTSWGINFMFSR